MATQNASPPGTPSGSCCGSCSRPSSSFPAEGGRLGSVELARNELVATDTGGLRAQATGEHESIPASLVFRAIGYRGIALPGVPFDERRAVIANDGGRVVDPDSGESCPGEYVVGWIKRGPSGVIGTNKKDAQETVDAMLADLLAEEPGPRSHAPANPDPDAIVELLGERAPGMITYAGWQAIDRHERELGENAGRPRVKLTRIEELLRAAAAQEP